MLKGAARTVNALGGSSATDNARGTVCWAVVVEDHQDMDRPLFGQDAPVRSLCSNAFRVRGSTFTLNAPIGSGVEPAKIGMLSADQTPEIICAGAKAKRDLRPGWALRARALCGSLHTDN